MKIRYTNTINLDDDKFKNLDKTYIREQVKNVLDNIITAMENDDFELHYLIDENKEKQNKY